MDHTRTSSQELIDQIREAQDLINQGIEMLKNAAHSDPNNRGWAEAYIISHLEVVASSEHGWMDRSQNIDTWIKHIERQSEEYDLDDEDESDEDDDEN